MTSISPSSIRWICRGALALAAVGVTCAVNGADLLVADRLSNGVYRYSESGELLGTVLRDKDAEFLNQPTGIALSPDSTRLYVSSSQNARVVRYDYNVFTGTASNPTIFADSSDGLAFPNDIRFSPDGGKIYVANLEGGVSQFHADGSSAGPKLTMPPPPEGGLFQTSSMSFLPTGELLVGAFQDFPGGTMGGVAISDDDVSALPEFLVEPTAAVNGATGLMIHEDYLYLTGLFSFNIRRFALSDGQIDSTWGISEVFFPQDLIEAPDGQGFLAGILGFSNGTGSISRYGFDGTFLGIFASPSDEGFIEATAFVAVPEPLLGDYNRDGTVDAADYTVWRDRFGTTDWLPNDDTPGSVDFSDYEAWRENFAAVSSLSGGASSAMVPEPGSILFALLASACYYATYRTQVRPESLSGALQGGVVPWRSHCCFFVFGILFSWRDWSNDGSFEVAQAANRACGDSFAGRNVQGEPRCSVFDCRPSHRQRLSLWPIWQSIEYRVDRHDGPRRSRGDRHFAR